MGIGRLVTSTNVTGSSTEDAFLKLLTYKNNSGPKMEPCNTHNISLDNIQFYNFYRLNLLYKWFKNNF